MRGCGGAGGWSTGKSGGVGAGGVRSKHYRSVVVGITPVVAVEYDPIGDMVNLVPES